MRVPWRRAHSGGVLVEAVRVALDLTKGDSGGLVDRLQGRSVVDLVQRAEHHGVGPAVHIALEGMDVDPELGTRLAAAYHRAIRTHLRAVEGLRMLHDVLGSVAPWVVVKGPVLAGLLYRRPDIRSYVDLDIVVPPARFAEAVEALEEAGCGLADRNWELLRDQVPGELRVMLPSGLWIDLHWHLVNIAAERNAFRLDTDALITRSRWVSIPGLTVPVRTLDQADTFLHLALHACLAGGDRLVWAADLHEAVRGDAPPWDLVVSRAREQQTALAVGAMLRRADRALPLGVPTEVLDDLMPPVGWAALTGAVDRLVPLETSTGRPSVSRIVMRATRSSGVASTAELVRRSARWVAGGAHREPRALDRDPSSPTSFLYEAGGVETRSAFFARVKASAIRVTDHQPPEPPASS